MPTEAQIDKVLRGILLKANLDQVTARTVQDQLETHFNEGLAEYKKFIRRRIQEIIESMGNAEPVEEEEVILKPGFE